MIEMINSLFLSFIKYFSKEKETSVKGNSVSDNKVKPDGTKV